MTYLEIVNKLLLRMRENRVEAVSGAYPELLGDFVNEAKTVVEDAWPWKRFRQTIVFNTVADQTDYDLSSVGTPAARPRSYLIEQQDMETVVISSGTYNGTVLTEIPFEALAEDDIIDQSADAVPVYYSWKRTADGVTMRIYPRPDAAYEISVRVYNPQADLSERDDELEAPFEPVWRLALAAALNERGDDGSMMEAKGRAALLEQISLEHDPEEYTLEAR